MRARPQNDASLRQPLAVRRRTRVRALPGDLPCDAYDDDDDAGAEVKVHDWVGVGIMTED